MAPRRRNNAEEPLRRERDLRDIEIVDLRRQVQQLQQQLLEQQQRSERDESHHDPNDEEGDDEDFNPFHGSRGSTYEARSRFRGHQNYAFQPNFNVRVDIPEFEGIMQPDEFIDWLYDVERIFKYHDVPEDRKVKLVAKKLINHASVWWKHLKKQRNYEGKGRIETWAKMKRLLKRKFLPDIYRRDTFLKFHNFKKWDKSVEEYTSHFKNFVMRRDVVEEDDVVSEEGPIFDENNNGEENEVSYIKEAPIFDKLEVEKVPYIKESPIYDESEGEEEEILHFEQTPNFDESEGEDGEALFFEEIIYDISSTFDESNGEESENCDFIDEAPIYDESDGEDDNAIHENHDGSLDVVVAYKNDTIKKCLEPMNVDSIFEDKVHSHIYDSQSMMMDEFLDKVTLNINDAVEFTFGTTLISKVNIDVLNFIDLKFTKGISPPKFENIVIMWTFCGKFMKNMIKFRGQVFDPGILQRKCSGILQRKCSGSSHIDGIKKTRGRVCTQRKRMTRKINQSHRVYWNKHIKLLVTNYRKCDTWLRRPASLLSYASIGFTIGII